MKYWYATQIISRTEQNRTEARGREASSQPREHSENLSQKPVYLRIKWEYQHMSQLKETPQEK